MPVIDGLQAANENLLAVAKVGATAALSAPKMARTHIKVEIVTGEDLLPLIEIVGILGETNAFVRGDHVVAKKASETGQTHCSVTDRCGRNSVRSGLELRGLRLRHLCRIQSLQQGA